MIKIKYLLIVIGLFILNTTHVFAGTDTDAICADTSANGLINKVYNVNYPGETATVYHTLKYVTPSIKNQYLGEIPKDFYKLYYIVGFQKKEGTLIRKSDELYEYDCGKQNAKLLQTLASDYYWQSYEVNHLNNNILIITKNNNEAKIEIEQIIGFDIASNKKLFSLTRKLFPGRLPSFARVIGCIAGSSNWYIYLDGGLQGEESLYSVNKKTKKITKL